MEKFQQWRRQQEGKMGYILLWALGVPIPVLFVIFLYGPMFVVYMLSFQGEDGGLDEERVETVGDRDRIGRGERKRTRLALSSPPRVAEVEKPLTSSTFAST